MSTNPELSVKIQQIFDDNKLEDLKFFLEKRHCLNATNSVLIYLFHVVQSVGILTTTIAAGYDQKYLIWVGVGLNILASLINVFEQTNNSIAKKLMNDINAIKSGNYVDEGAIIEQENDNTNKSASSVEHEIA